VKAKLLNLFRIFLIINVMLIVGTNMASAQKAVTKDTIKHSQATTDSVAGRKKSVDTTMAVKPIKMDSMKVISLGDTAKKAARDWKTWRPSPQRALWLALVLPGAGQIYNQKFWKLPIVYGGIMGCIYAMRWNNMMYRDYSQAYLDIMDDDPNTASYNQFLHLGAKITSSNQDHYTTIFKKRKDYYRRYRDLSFFVLVGVYAISVIDAYVDAELSEFDISRDLSMKIEPAVINSRQSNNPLKSSAVGLQCSLHF
jgi:hypothetical protein